MEKKKKKITVRQPSWRVEVSSLMTREGSETARACSGCFRRGQPSMCYYAHTYKGISAVLLSVE